MDKTKCYYCQESSIEGHVVFCSIECAVYSGCYSVTKGWIRNVEEYCREKEEHKL